MREVQRGAIREDGGPRDAREPLEAGALHYAREQGKRYWTAAPLLARLASEGRPLAEWRGGAGRRSP